MCSRPGLVPLAAMSVQDTLLYRPQVFGERRVSFLVTWAGSQAAQGLFIPSTNNGGCGESTQGELSRRLKVLSERGVEGQKHPKTSLWDPAAGNPKPRRAASSMPRRGFTAPLARPSSGFDSQPSPREPSYPKVPPIASRRRVLELGNRARAQCRTRLVSPYLYTGNFRRMALQFRIFQPHTTATPCVCTKGALGWQCFVLVRTGRSPVPGGTKLNGQARPNPEHQQRRVQREHARRAIAPSEGAFRARCRFVDVEQPPLKLRRRAVFLTSMGVPNTLPRRRHGAGILFFRLRLEREVCHVPTSQQIIIMG